MHVYLELCLIQIHPKHTFALVFVCAVFASLLPFITFRNSIMKVSANERDSNITATITAAYIIGSCLLSFRPIICLRIENINIHTDYLFRIWWFVNGTNWELAHVNQFLQPTMEYTRIHVRARTAYIVAPLFVACLHSINYLAGENIFGSMQITSACVWRGYDLLCSMIWNSMYDVRLILQIYSHVCTVYGFESRKGIWIRRECIGEIAGGYFRMCVL